MTLFLFSYGGEVIRHSVTQLWRNASILLKPCLCARTVSGTYLEISPPKDFALSLPALLQPMRCNYIDADRCCSCRRQAQHQWRRYSDCVKSRQLSFLDLIKNKQKLQDASCVLNQGNLIANPMLLTIFIRKKWEETKELTNFKETVKDIFFEGTLVIPFVKKILPSFVETCFLRNLSHSLTELSVIYLL